MIKRILTVIAISLVCTSADAQQKRDSMVLRRDPVGDINAEQVSNAEIPGSVVIGRTNYGVIGIGGFFKTMAIFDSHSELRVDAFLPGYLGIPGVDPAVEGQFFLDARATRLNFSALADIDGMRFKGYVEWNFRGEPTNFSFRLAYLSMSSKSGNGELLAGKYFSQIGDLYAVPDAVSEPTVSGLLVNVREEQIRWTQKISQNWKLGFSLENTPTNDLFGLQFKQRSSPALATSLLWLHPKMKTHFFIGGLLRTFFVTDSTAKNYHNKGWILSGGTHVNLSSKTRLQYAVGIGDAIGSYMVGTDPLSAGILLPGKGLELRRGLGHYLALQYKWNNVVRSNLMSGITVLEENAEIPSLLTRNSTQFGLNTFVRIKRFLTIGGEYWFGTRKTLAETKWSNNRFSIGMQLF